MNCSIEGYPREYEASTIMHTARHKGQVVVIDHVPADDCSFCGDALLKPDTVRKIESRLQKKGQSANPTSAPRPNASASKLRTSKVYYRDRIQRRLSCQITPEDEESRVPSHRR